MFSQSGTVRIFKRRWIWNCTSFENLTQVRSLVLCPAGDKLFTWYWG